MFEDWRRGMEPAHGGFVEMMALKGNSWHFSIVKDPPCRVIPQECGFKIFQDVEKKTNA